MRFQIVGNANRNPIYFTTDKKKPSASEPRLSLKLVRASVSLPLFLSLSLARASSASLHSERERKRMCLFVFAFIGSRPRAYGNRACVSPAGLQRLYTTIGRSLIPGTRFPFRLAVSILVTFTRSAKCVNERSERYETVHRG